MTTGDNKNNPSESESKSVETGKGVELPLMITKDMRQQLLDRGMSKKTIGGLTPEEAWKFLNGEKEMPVERRASKLDNLPKPERETPRRSEQQETDKEVAEKSDAKRIDEIAEQVSNLTEELATLIKKQAEENAKLQSGGTATVEPKLGWEAPEFGEKFIKAETLIDPKEKAEVLRTRAEQAEAAARSEAEQAEAARVAELTEAIKEYPTERINEELTKLMAKSGLVDMSTPEGKAEREEIRNEIEIYMGELDRRDEERSVKWVDRQREGVEDEISDTPKWDTLRSLKEIESRITKSGDYFSKHLSNLQESVERGKDFNKEDIETIGNIIAENQGNFDEREYKNILSELQVIPSVETKFADKTLEVSKQEVDDLMNDASVLLDKQKPGKAEHYDFLKRVADLKKADISEEDSARLDALHARLIELNSPEMENAEETVMACLESMKIKGHDAERYNTEYIGPCIEQAKKGDFFSPVTFSESRTIEAQSIQDILQARIADYEMRKEYYELNQGVVEQSPEDSKAWEASVEKAKEAIGLLEKLKTKATDIKGAVVEASSEESDAEIIRQENYSAEEEEQIKALARQKFYTNSPRDLTQEELDLMTKHSQTYDNEMRRLEKEDLEDADYKIALKRILYKDKSYKVTNTWLQSVCGTDIEETKALSKALIAKGVLGPPDPEYGTMEILLDEKPSDVPKENLSAAMLEDMQKQNKEKGVISKFLGKRKSEKPTGGNGEATAPESPPQTPPSVDSTPGEVKEKRGFWGRIIGFLGKRNEPKPPR